MIKKGLNSVPLFASRLLVRNKPYFNRFLTPINFSPFSTNPKTSSELLSDAEREKVNESLVQGEFERLKAERLKELQTLSDEKEFPSGALLAGALITAPLLVGSLALNAFAFSNLFVDNLPMLFMSLVKYSGLHLTFMVRFCLNLIHMIVRNSLGICNLRT